jgi:hypothetical protein
MLNVSRKEAAVQSGHSSSCKCDANTGNGPLKEKTFCLPHEAPEDALSLFCGTQPLP